VQTLPQPRVALARSLSTAISKKQDLQHRHTKCPKMLLVNRGLPRVPLAVIPSTLRRMVNLDLGGS